jgi:hypothetical protein
LEATPHAFAAAVLTALEDAIDPNDAEKAYLFLGRLALLDERSNVLLRIGGPAVCEATMPAVGSSTRQRGSPVARLPGQVRPA